MNAIRVENIHKTFVLHQQNGVRLPVLADASLSVNVGECVVLHGHSGSGKSTLLRSLYANYLPIAATSISATAMNGWIWSPPRRAKSWKCVKPPSAGLASFCE